MTSRWLSGCMVVLIGALSLLGRDALAGDRPVLVKGDGELVAGVFKAGPSGARYSIPGGVRLAFRPGTQAQVAAVPQLLPLRPGRRTPTYSVVLREGRVDIDVQPKGSRTAVLVAAPCGLKAIVLRGQLVARATQSEASAANLGADALVSVDDQWQSLGQGAIWTLGRGDPQGRKTEVLPAPSSLSGSSILLGFTGRTSLKDFGWSAVPGARAYGVTLVREGEEDPIGSLVTPSTKLSGPLGPLSAGRYELRVTSIDASGLGGRASEPFPIRVLGAQLPLGAAVLDNATVELGQGQTVSFTETDGMLMRYAGMDGPLAADSPIGLNGARTRFLSLSFPGAFTGAMVRLRPRKLAAGIQFGPRDLTWPGPPATVSVELTNGGEPIPPWLMPVFTATINLEPVEVEFTRDGDTLQATVPAPGGSGPWVVRVEVRDQTGALLGRDFLEVGVLEGRAVEGKLLESSARRATSSLLRPSSTARLR